MMMQQPKWHAHRCMAQAWFAVHMQLRTEHVTVSGYHAVSGMHAGSSMHCGSWCMHVCIPSLIEGVWEVQVETKSAACGWIFRFGEIQSIQL